MLDPNQTIAAISSPSGAAGRAIVRASGPAAFKIAAAVFRPAGPTALEDLEGFRAVGGAVRFDGGALPARAYVFRAPRSYTRQDLVELHLPGNPLAAAGVLTAMLQAGARPAAAGEFTLRAFLSGRIDLSAAEGVADVIDAATDGQLAAAARNAGGALRKLCARWSGAIAEALAETEASIDIATEDLELIAPADLAARLGALGEDMRRTRRTAARITSTAVTPRAVLAGEPNVGKSSLLNALTGLDRAIVSATAHTTRDVLTAPMTLPNGREILLVDLAGLAADPGGVVTRAADRAARAALAGADAVVIVLDATAPDMRLLDEVALHRSTSAATVAINKIDLLTSDQAESLRRRIAAAKNLPTLTVSARSREGLDDLISRLGESLGLEAARGESLCALHDRQRDAITRAAEAIDRAAAAMRPLGHLADRAEILAVELRTALAQVGTISGEAIGEEILGRIFRRFCVGK